MIGLIAPAVIGAAAGLFGGARQNQQNKEQARNEMAFQERMSSTAVQRSVEDYKAAGLNPALAYDRSASSPGGASAQIGNTIEQSVNGAQSYRAAAQAFQANQQAMQIAKEQSRADLAVKSANVAATLTQSEKTEQERRGLIQQFTGQQEMLPIQIQRNKKELEDLMDRIKMNPSMLRQAQAQSLLTELGIPAAKNAANFEEWMGGASKGVGFMKDAGQTMKVFGEIIRMMMGTGGGGGISIHNWPKR